MAQLTPGCCCAVERVDSVFCFLSTMLLSSEESSGSGRLGPSVACMAVVYDTGSTEVVHSTAAIHDELAVKVSP